MEISLAKQLPDFLSSTWAKLLVGRATTNYYEISASYQPYLAYQSKS
jgi:hypothetical protein